MANILLNKVINQEIPSSLLIKWLLKASPGNKEDFSEIYASKVNQIDFITFFLNFIHEEIPCNNVLPDTPQKLFTPKRIDKTQPSSNRSEPKVFRTKLFSPTNNTESAQNVGFHAEPKATTPKVPPRNINDSYFSPISPLYEHASQSSFNNSKQCTHEKQGLCLGDFLVSSPKNSIKKKKKNLPPMPKLETSRRIKPTDLNLNPNIFQNTQNSFNFQDSPSELSDQLGAAEERSLLAEERLKILSRKTERQVCPSLLKRQSSLSRSDVKPSLSMVTYKSNITQVIDIYKALLKHRFVLNITSELYFLISLVLSKNAGKLDDKSESTDGVCEIGDSVCNLQIFETIHNVVYFAIKMLESQVNEIQFYDRTTIKLLAENERIKDFSPDLSKKLLQLAQEKAEKPSIDVTLPSSQTNVYFNIDTDNKENFPDLPSFHAFRKQRDMFYEILRVWESQHLTTGWNFSQGLSGKIRSLFAFHGGAANLMHLSRLFKNQLLSSCSRGSREKGLSESDLSFLPSLPVDADKLRRLTNRLITKEANSGINASPVFSGYQEFFKEFIAIASNCAFSRHLCDCLIFDIIELNDMKFSGTDLEEEGDELDPNTNKLYVNCLRDLRILSKFLGFLESLPYKTDVPNLQSNVIQLQIEVRSKTTPLLDVKSLIQRAIDNHTVVYIIPWLTNYLAMLDYVTLRLPYYTALLTILFNIYRNYGSTTDNKPSFNTALVKLCLGWLFELPHFPDIEYFNFCTKLIQGNAQKEFGKLNGVSSNSRRQELDFKAVVDQNVLYMCCPYLEEIKKNLTVMNASGNKMAVKYITPVTALESNTEMVKKKVEQQLEEAFFSGQPMSVRKTVEFVSERIASTAVKHICHNLVPKAKEEALSDLRSLFKSDNIEQHADDNHRKTALKKQAVPLAQTHLTRFLQLCEQEMQQISLQKIPPSIHSLLPVDTLSETTKVCVGITTKMYNDRVKQWLGSHVNLTLFTKDFDSEIQKEIITARKGEKKKTTFVLPPAGKDCSHDETILSGFHSLDRIREICCKVVEKNQLTSDTVLRTIQDTFRCLTERNDVNATIVSVVSMTVFDFYLLLVVQHSEMLRRSIGDLERAFLNIWALQPKHHSAFKTLFCPRNVKMIQGAQNKELAWDLYARLVGAALGRQIIELDDLESQCTGFYNKNWDSDTLSGFSHFLKMLATCSQGNEKFALLLDFLSDYCSDL